MKRTIRNEDRRVEERLFHSSFSNGGRMSSDLFTQGVLSGPYVYGLSDDPISWEEGTHCRICDTIADGRLMADLIRARGVRVHMIFDSDTEQVFLHVDEPWSKFPHQDEMDDADAEDAARMVIVKTLKGRNGE